MNKDTESLINLFLHEFLKENEIIINQKRLKMRLGSNRFSIGNDDKGIVLMPNFTLKFHSPTYSIKKGKTYIYEYLEHFVDENKKNDLKNIILKKIKDITNNENKEVVDNLQKAIFGGIEITEEEKQANNELRVLKDEVGEDFLTFLKNNTKFLKNQENSYLHISKKISVNILNKNNALELKEETINEMLIEFAKFIKNKVGNYSAKYKTLFQLKRIKKLSDFFELLNYNEFTFEKMPVLFFTKTNNGYSIQLRASEINKKVEDYSKRYKVLGNSTSFFKNINKNTKTLIIGEGLTDYISLIETLSIVSKNKDILPELKQTGVYSIQSAGSSIMEINNLLKAFDGIENVVFLNDNDEAGQLFVNSIIENFLISKDVKNIKFINGTDVLENSIGISDFDISDLFINNKQEIITFIQDILKNTNNFPFIDIEYKNKLSILSYNNLDHNKYIVNENDFFVDEEILSAYKNGKSMYMIIGSKNKGTYDKYNKYIKLETESQVKQFIKGEKLSAILFEEYKYEKYDRKKHNMSDIYTLIDNFKDNLEYKELTTEEKNKYEKRLKKGLGYFENIYTRIKDISPTKAQSFLDYFFETKKFTDWACENNIIYTTSGSAGGSIILKLMNITTISLKDLLNGEELAEERYLNPYIDVSNYLPDIDIELPNDEKTKKKLELYLKENGIKKALLGNPGNYVLHNVKYYLEKEKTKLPYIPKENNILMQTEVAMDFLVRSYRNPIQTLSEKLGTTNIGDTRRLLEFYGEYKCSIDDLEIGVIGNGKIPQFKILALEAAHKYYGVDYEYEYSIKAKDSKDTKTFYKLKNTDDKFVDEKNKLYSEYNGKISSIYNNGPEYSIIENSKDIEFLNDKKYMENSLKRKQVQNITGTELEYFTSLSRPYYTNSMISTKMSNGEIISFDIDKENKTIRREDGIGEVYKYENQNTKKENDNSYSIRIIVNEYSAKTKNYNTNSNGGKEMKKLYTNKFFTLKKDKKYYLINLKYINYKISSIPKNEIKEIDLKNTNGKKIMLVGQKYYIWNSREETLELNSDIVKNFEGYKIPTEKKENIYSDFYNNKYTIIKNQDGTEKLQQLNSKKSFKIIKKSEVDGEIKLILYREYDKKNINMSLSIYYDGKSFFEGYDKDFVIKDIDMLNALKLNGEVVITKKTRYLFDKFLENNKNKVGSNFKDLISTNGIIVKQEQVMSFLEEIYQLKYKNRNEYFSKINYIRKMFNSLGKIPLEIIQKISKDYLPELKEIIYNIPDFNKRKEALEILNEQILRPAFLFNSSHAKVMEEAIMLTISSSKYNNENLILFTNEENKIVDIIYNEFTDISIKLGNKIYMKKEYMKEIKYIYEMNLIIFGKEDNFLTIQGEDKAVEFLINKRDKYLENNMSEIEYKKFLSKMLTNSYIKKKNIPVRLSEFLVKFTYVMGNPPTSDIIFNKEKYIQKQNNNIF